MIVFRWNIARFIPYFLVSIFNIYQGLTFQHIIHRTTLIYLLRHFDIYFTFILGGAIPDAHAIHAARKRREAMRESGQSADPKSARSYIPLKGGEDTDKKMHSPRQDDDDDSDAEESRINFTGVRSAAAVKSRQFEELDNSPAQSGGSSPKFKTNPAKYFYLDELCS